MTPWAKCEFCGVEFVPRAWWRRGYDRDGYLVCDTPCPTCGKDTRDALDTLRDVVREETE